MKAHRPSNFDVLAKSIASSWLTPESNYVLISPPLSRGEEILKLLCSPAIHVAAGIDDASVSLAFLSGAEINGPVDFADKVIEQWGANDKDDISMSAVDRLDMAIRSVVESGRRPVLIIRQFHKAIERLSWDIGSALRNLEHDYGLCTVVELPIRLSSLRDRWSGIKRDAPFLASDFGQGHSTKIASPYEYGEAKRVYELYGINTGRFDLLYELTHGIPGLIPWAAREATGQSSDAELKAHLARDSAEMLSRFFRWLDAPDELIFRRLLQEYPTRNSYDVDFQDHDWAGYLINRNGEIPSIFRNHASLQPSGRLTEVPSAVPNTSSQRRGSAETSANSSAKSDLTHLGSKALVLFSTAWGTKHGGINSFNLEFCNLVEKALSGSWQLICIVPSRRSISAATSLCSVIPLRDGGDEDFALSDVPKAIKVLRGMAKSFVVVGHDVKTAHISNSVGLLLNAGRVVFSHMAYDNYYSLIGGSGNGQAKVEEQRSIFSDADTIYAVGPKLHRYVLDQIRAVGSKAVTKEFRPPLIQNQCVEGPRFTPKITFIGRIEPGRDTIKQSKLAVASIGRAIHDAGQSIGDVTVQIVGAPVVSPEEERQIKRQLAEEAKRAVTCNYLPFIDDRARTLTLIRDSSLVVMPSFHEGFGLVAWEAISMGVPVIVSQNSGVHLLISELGLTDFIGEIRVGGAEDDDSFEVDVKSLAGVIEPRLTKLASHQQNALFLRQRLSDEIGNASIVEFVSHIDEIVQRPAESLPF